MQSPKPYTIYILYHTYLSIENIRWYYLSFSQRLFTMSFPQRLSHNVFLTTSFSQRLYHNVFTTSFTQRLSHNVFLTTSLSQHHSHDFFHTTTFSFSQYHSHNVFLTTSFSQRCHHAVLLYIRPDNVVLTISRYTNNHHLCYIFRRQSFQHLFIRQTRRAPAWFLQ